MTARVRNYFISNAKAICLVLRFYIFQTIALWQKSIFTRSPYCQTDYLRVIVVMLFSCVFSSCSPVQHGYKIEDDMPSKIQKMVDEKANINQIIMTFGSPSFANSPINDTICYVEANGKKIAFNRFYKPTYKFLCIIFENQIAKETKSWTLAKIEKMKMTNYNFKLEKPL